MLRLTASGLACALTFTLVGCGPMTSPLPTRLGDDSQKQIDESWDRAMSPPTKLDHADLLDVLVGTQAYQIGVDTFSLRAEKRFAGGKVVMEVAFDRARPDDDRFDVSVFDTTGKRVRKERFQRDEVDAAYSALFVNPPPPKADNVPDQPGMAARRAAYDARWKKVTDVFPNGK